MRRYTARVAGELISVRERTGPDAGRVHRLGEGRHVIGRDPTAAVSLASSDVSRHHALLTVTADSLELADLGSKNGVRIARGDGFVPLVGARRVGDGAVFEVGGIELEVSHPGVKVQHALARVGETTVTRIDGPTHRGARPEVVLPLVATVVFATVVALLLWLG